MSAAYIHPTAIVESDAVGSGTRVWAFAHVMRDACVGSNCNLGNHTFVEGGARIGNNVTVKNHVCVWEGVTLEDDTFIGPLVAFTNDLAPRSPRMSAVSERYDKKENWLAHTIVEEGASIGANATIVAGVKLGRYCFVAAGAVVTRDVPPFTLVKGTPSRPCGRVCRCGQRLGTVPPAEPCSRCGTAPSFFVSN